MLSDHPDESSPKNNQPQSLSGQLLTTPTDNTTNFTKNIERLKVHVLEILGTVTLLKQGLATVK